MVIDSISTLVQEVTKSRLLEPLQQDELTRELQSRYVDAKQLARALLERDWLTSLQINYLFQGRIGDLILGSYLLRERLGESRAGQVFKARHLHLRRIAAVKIIREDLLADSRVVERFYQEIQAISALDHPHIVHAYDAGPVGHTHFYAMEFVPGADLGRFIKQSGPLPIEQACDAICQAALGLQYAYERGLIHHDVKPGNLLAICAAAQDTPLPGATPSTYRRAQAGQIKIRNLGLTPLDVTASPLFVAGHFRGDPDYRAPELADPSVAPDIRAEMYSFGCTFYFLLTGQPPFPEGDAAAKMRRHQSEEPLAVERLRAGVPPGVTAIVHKLMAKKPEARFQTPTEVVSALAELSHSGINLSGDGKGGSGRLNTARRLLTRLGGQAKKRVSRLAGAGSSLRLRLAQNQRRWSKIKWYAAGFLALYVVGATLLAWRGLTAPPKNVHPEAVDPIQSAWNKLQSQADTAHYREAVHAFRWKYPGTPQAAEAQALLTRLTSPCDALDGKTIPKSERQPGQPAELVAVLGTHRGRHWAEVSCLAFSGDGKLLASGGLDKDIRLWDASTLEEGARLQGHTKRVLALAFASDHTTLASSSEDGSVRIWNLVRGRWESFPLKGQAGPVAALAFVPGSKKLACGCVDKVIRIWEVSAEPPPPVILSGHGAAVSALAVSADGATLVSGSADQSVRLWDLAAGKPKDPGVLRGHGAPILGVAVAPDGKTAVSSSADNSVRLWRIDGTQPAERPPLTGCRHPAYGVAFCSHGQTVAASDEQTVHLWNVSATSALPLKPLATHPGRIHAVRFAPNGKTLATCGTDAMIRLWNVELARPTAKTAMIGHGGPVLALDFSADHKSLASAGLDGTARVWVLPDLKERLVLRHPAGVNGLRFADDDKTLVTSCQDGHVRSWDLTSGKPKPIDVSANFAGGGTASLSPDGAAMVTADYNKLFLWDMHSGKKRDWTTLPGAVTCLRIAPDGRHVVVGNVNGTLYILRLPQEPRTK